MIPRRSDLMRHINYHDGNYVLFITSLPDCKCLAATSIFGLEILGITFGIIMPLNYNSNMNERYKQLDLEIEPGAKDLRNLPLIWKEKLATRNGSRYSESVTHLGRQSSHDLHD